MDLNRLIQMIVNMFVRKAVNKGINAGIDYASRRGKPAGEMTPEERKQAQDARAIAKRACQAARITRKLGR
jgi:hypothetical protein